MGYRYKIQPLKWESFGREGDLIASTIFGNISIDVTAMTWRHCFDEYYDEDTHSGCSSVEECKMAAQEFYLGRLLPALKRTR